jgi:hypothetical protein
MNIERLTLSLPVGNPFPWYADWVWSLLLIVLTVLIHVLGLLLIDKNVGRVQDRVAKHCSYPVVFVLIIGSVTLLATLLHGMEALFWACAYRLVGALPDNSSALLYSMSAVTSYGHEKQVLEEHWQLMGAMEALNGWLLFGLTTAFLYGVIRRVLSLHATIAVKPSPRPRTTSLTSLH